VFGSDDRGHDHRFETPVAQVGTAGVNGRSSHWIERRDFSAGAAPPAHADGTVFRADEFYAAYENGVDEHVLGIRNFIGSNKEAQLRRRSMEIRRQELEEPFGITPERMYEVLTTPSAIRSWWGVSKAVVDLREGGTWVTAWGEGEEDADHVVAFKILELDPPKRFVLGASKYIVSSQHPLESDMTTEFNIDAHPSGCNLRIVQELNPYEPWLEDYFDAFVAGWENCFEGIRKYLHLNPVE